MLKRIRWTFLPTLAATLGLVAASPAAIAQQTKSVSLPLLECPFGCGPTAGDTVLMNQMILAHAKVTLIPQETPGYIYNVRAMGQDKSKWPHTVFSTEDTLLQLAMKWGGTPVLKSVLPERVNVKFKLLYGEMYWPIGKFFVTFDPSIKTIADLKGKRVGIGLVTQSDWGLYPPLLLNYGYGINSKNTKIYHLSPAVLTQQLINGTIDAAVTVFGMQPEMKDWLVGTPLRQLAASGKPLHYIGVDKAALEKLNKKFGTTFLYAEIPAGTLPGQKEAFATGVNRGFKAVGPGFPPDLAYDIVMTVAKLGEKMSKLNALWKVWSPNLMISGLSDENVNPGAKRAYEELGWWDKRKQYPPMTYPQ